LSLENTELDNLEVNFQLNNKSKIFSNFSFLSQAYVFYKFSQTKVPNFDKLRSVLQYHGIFFGLKNEKEIKDSFQTQGRSFFLKKEIKDSFRKQGIMKSQLKEKRSQNSRVQQWKNWLKSHYQLHLSTDQWSLLEPRKWRNSLTQRCRVKDSQLSKGLSYKKDRLSHYIKEKKKNYEDYVVLLQTQKEDFQKTYRYDLLASKYIYFV
jgi:hypothetical protein